MFKSREDFISQLGTASMPVEFGMNFAAVMDEFDTYGVPFLTDAYIDALQMEFALFPNKFDFVKNEAMRIREDGLLSRYTLLLKHMLKDKDPQKLLILEDEPTSDDISRKIDLEMAGLFAELAYVPDMVKEFRSRGVPEYIIRDTLRCFEVGILVCNGCFDRDGYEINRSFMWNQHYIAGRIINIGVLCFEIKKMFTDIVRIFTNSRGEYRILSNGQRISTGGLIAGSMNCTEEQFVAAFQETDDGYEGFEVDTVNTCVTDRTVFLSKQEWFPAITESDHVINVHIPDSGCFTKEAIAASYAEAKAFFESCYPEFRPKAFTCESWLMDPKIKELLGENSNIVGFQSKYMRFPKLSNGNACFKFLFRKPFVSYEAFPATTSLQRKVKDLYLAGGCIYDPCGIFFFNQM